MQYTIKRILAFKNYYFMLHFLNVKPSGKIGKLSCRKKGFTLLSFSGMQILYVEVCSPKGQHIIII